MKRIHRFVFSFILVMVILLGFLYFSPKGDFEWGVSIGDSFQYEVQTLGEYGNQYIGGYPSPTIENLNNSILNVVVGNLPAVEWVIGANHFTSSVVETIKVNCSFANETELLSADNEIISRIISLCLLPTGDWSVIDAFYVDEIAPWNPSHEYYAARLVDGDFIFEWTKYGDFDSTEDWTGHIKIENGMPFEIMWHYKHSADIYIKLSLVEI